MLKLGNPFGQPSTGALPYGYNVQTDPIFIEPKPQFQRVKLVPPQAVPLPAPVPAVPSIPIPAPRPAAPEYRGPVFMGSRAGLPPELQASRRISLDFNSAPNVTSPGVEIIVPQDVSDQEAEAASAYAQGVASLFDAYGYGGYGIRPSPFKPGVKRKGIEASRGMSNTFHLEPFFLQDERAREIFMQPEFQADYADLINRTVRTIPNSVTIAPHVGPGKDQGAQFDFDGQTITEYGLGMQILPQLDQQREMQTLMSPGRGNFPLQERFENSGILPMIGQGMRANLNMVAPTAIPAIRGARTLADFATGQIDKNEFGRRSAAILSPVLGPMTRLPSFEDLYRGMRPGMPASTPQPAPALAPTPVTPPAPTAADAGKGPGLPSGALGLFSDPEVTRTVAQEAVTAAEQVGSVRGGSKPLTKPQRDRMNPMNLGLIAFGLSLLGGKDITESMNNGMVVSQYMEDRRDKQRQREAFDEYMQSLSPEEQQIARQLEASGNIQAFAEMQQERAKEEVAEAEKAILVNQLAQISGADPSALAQLSVGQLQSELAKRAFAGADGAGGDFTKEEQKAAFAAMEMEDAYKDMVGLMQAGYDPNNFANFATNRSDFLAFEAAFNRFLTAYVPFKSGAAFSAQEVQNYRNALEPRGGFNNAAANQARFEAIQSILGTIKQASGGGYDFYMERRGNPYGIERAGSQ